MTKRSYRPVIVLVVLAAMFMAFATPVLADALPPTSKLPSTKSSSWKT